MKKLLAVAIMILATNAFAKTYTVQYSTDTEHAVTKNSKSTYQFLPTPANSGVIKIFTMDEASHKNVIVKQEALTQSPINFLMNITSKTTVELSDANSKIFASVAATIMTAPLTKKILGVVTNVFALNEVPVIDNQVKDALANMLGNNNFKMKVTSENNIVSCIIRDLKCTVGIYRYYQIEAE